MIALLCSFFVGLTLQAQIAGKTQEAKPAEVKATEVKAPESAPSAAQAEQQLLKKPDNLALRLKVTQLYAEENNAAKVIELLNPYTDQIPNEGFQMLARAYAANEDHANEVRVLKIMAEKGEDNFRWRMLLGQAYLKQAYVTKDVEKKDQLLTQGIQELRTCMNLNKKFKPAYDLLLSTLLEQKANSEARELLHEGLRKFGLRPELYRELCRLDSLDGFLDSALTNCRESIKASPNYPDHYVYLVQTLFDQKQEPMAERQIVAAAKKFPDSEFVQFAAGKLFLNKKNYPVATRYYQAAVKAGPKEARSQFGLAQALFESGSVEAALPHYIEACKLDLGTLDDFRTSAGRVKQDPKASAALSQKYSQATNTCRN
jgi:predicted Zn-dependent protease